MQKHQALEALSLFSLPVDYADVRIEKVEETSIVFKNGELLSSQGLPSEGAFLRVYHQGRWHEAAITDVSGLKEALDGLVARALKSRPGKGPQLPIRQAQHHEYAPYEKSNCTHVGHAEKMAFCRGLLSVPGEFPEIKDWTLSYTDRYKQKWFKAKDGVSFTTDYNQASVRIGYSLSRGDKKFSDGATVWFMRSDEKELKVKEHFIATIKESIEFLDAETVVPGKYEVLLAPEITGVFTHESFGHKSEADFMLGDETMLKEWTIGKKVAADIVSIVDEGDTVGSSGYCPVDDEGNRKQKTYLIRNGELAGRLHSMTTSVALNEANSGNGRALNFEFPPIPRMTNTYIEGGTKPVAEIIAGIKKGFYIKTFKHGSGMSTFTIAPVRSYLIEDGKITRPVRIAVISGSVFETLMNIKAVANDFEVKSSAFGGCGKFEQYPLPIADGGPSILVEGMQVS